MKHLSKIVVAVVLLFGFSSMYAQDEDNPWRITLGVNAVDFYPTNQPGQGKWFDEFFNVNDHYNIIPSISAIEVARYMGDGFTLGIRGTLNRIDKFGDEPADDLSYFGLDGTVAWHWFEWEQGKWFDPFLEIGGGYTWVDEIGAGTLNGGIGINFWFTDTIGLTLQSNYKHVFEDYPGIRPHFQHLLGLSIKFGGKDTDRDGIYDKYDACPEVAGLPEFNGCPDTDGDGIEDGKDRCPNEAGPAEFNGCPDIDGDGIPDIDDECPTEAGPASLNGCPDRDNDGVADKDDECPDVAGPAANQGCPWPDQDGDGVFDKDDECPTLPGTVANNGCPEVTAEVEAQIRDLARTVYFDTGKSTFKDETYGRLDGLVAIMNQYPNQKWVVEGHTDSTGSAELNQRLSYSRADAVMDYFISKGIPAANIKAVGYGEERPIADNNTRAGRASNRRTEVRAVRELD